MTRRDGASTEWWLILDGDPELGRLVRHLYALAIHRTRVVRPPMWGPHVSVVRGEVPPQAAAWHRLAGQAFEFEYDDYVRETDGYLWFPVRCPATVELREELGLPPEPDPPLHFTIGNVQQD